LPLGPGCFAGRPAPPASSIAPLPPPLLNPLRPPHPRTPQDAAECGFDFIVAPLADPARRPALPAPPPADGALRPPFLPAQVIHTTASAQLSNQIVGKISAWIDPDAEDPEVRRASAAALREELAWASHLTVQACLLPAPRQGARAATYARLINHAIVSNAASMALWLLVPACSPAAAAADAADAAAEGAEERAPSAADDSWEWWSAMRFACHHATRLSAALEVGPDLPPAAGLARWWGEPLKALVLRTDAFSTNRRGYPALSRRHQELLSEAFARGVQVVLSGDARHAPPPPPPPPPPPQDAAAAAAGAGPTPAEAGAGPTPAEAGAPPPEHPLRPYWEYLSFLFRRREAGDPQEALEAPYRDYLQVPLQPLQDNLESATYETFERDSTKYEVYGEAVRQALVDAAAAEAGGGGGWGVSVVMVVGAGRGPLVAASLAAGAAAGRAVRVYAVEKNPNAVVHLHARAAAEGWGAAVTVVHADMRAWRAPEPADVLVSELLGSFGDNELSPECLDGAQRFLRPGGVSIPAAYTSFLHPVTAHKLWNDARAYDDVEHFETPYVVKLFRVSPLAPPQPVFTFAHPNLDPVIDNTRAATLLFKCTPPGGTGEPPARASARTPRPMGAASAAVQTAPPAAPRFRRAALLPRCPPFIPGPPSPPRHRSLPRPGRLLRGPALQGRHPLHPPPHPHPQHVFLVPHLVPAARALPRAARRRGGGQHVALRERRQGVVRVGGG
jgi:protein arginine N-methyltransferase 5